MTVYYSLTADSRADVRFRGSHVPSQSYYRDWRLCGEYDMLRCSGYQFDDFIQAGDGKDAKVFEITVL